MRRFVKIFEELFEENLRKYLRKFETFIRNSAFLCVLIGENRKDGIV